MYMNAIAKTIATTTVTMTSFTGRSCAPRGWFLYALVTPKRPDSVIAANAKAQTSSRERYGGQGDHDPDDDQRDVEDQLSVPGSPSICGRCPATRPTEVGDQSAHASGGDQYSDKANDEKPVHRRTVHRVQR